MNKGERTRIEILHQSFIYSSQYGLANITIGQVAKLCNLSRTGVISHFKDKEDMQIAILEYGEELFKERVIKASWRDEPLQQLIALIDNWSIWTAELLKKHQVSCPFIKAVVEFQNRPDSKVRTFTLEQQNRLIAYLTHRVQRCIDAKELANTSDSKTIAYEVYSLYLGHVVTQHSSTLVFSSSIFKQSLTRLLHQYKPEN